MGRDTGRGGGGIEPGRGGDSGGASGFMFAGGLLATGWLDGGGGGGAACAGIGFGVIPMGLTGAAGGVAGLAPGGGAVNGPVATHRS